MYYFYAQGLNTGLEDCDELDQRLARNPRAEALRLYQESRKPSADSISKLSRGNFVTLKDKVASPLYHGKHVIELFLNRILGRLWLPTYRLISESERSQARVRRLLAIRRSVFTLSGLPLLVGLVSMFVSLDRVFRRRRLLPSEAQPRFVPEATTIRIKDHVAFKLVCLLFGSSLLFAAEAPKKTVRVGLASTLSDIGTSSSIPHGDFFRRGIQLALKHSAKRLQKSGIHIELKEFDYGNDRLKVMEVARNAVASDVAAVIGYNFSDHAILFESMFQERTFSALAITHWDQKMVNRFTTRFLAEYEAANGQVPNMTAAMAYDSMLFLIEALQGCSGLDRLSIEGCLNKQKTFEGVTGSYRFPKTNAAPEKSLVLLKRKNRRFEFLKVVSP